MNIRKLWFLSFLSYSISFIQIFGAALQPEIEPIFKNQTVTEFSEKISAQFASFDKEATELLQAGIFQTSARGLLETMKSVAKIKVSLPEITRLAYLTTIPLSNPINHQDKITIQTNETTTEELEISQADAKYINKTRELTQLFYSNIFSDRFIQSEYESVLSGNLENHYNDFGFLIFHTCRDWLTQLNPTSSIDTFDMPEAELAETITILCLYLKHFGDFR